MKSALVLPGAGLNVWMGDSARLLTRGVDWLTGIGGDKHSELVFLGDPAELAKPCVLDYHKKPPPNRVLAWVWI